MNDGRQLRATSSKYSVCPAVKLSSFFGISDPAEEIYFTNPSWAERGVADRSGLLLPDCPNEMLQSYRINESLICIIKFS